MDILIVKPAVGGERGFIAYFHSQPGTWEFGYTKAEAIGKLILSTRGSTTAFRVEERKH